MITFERNEFTFGSSTLKICSWVSVVDLPLENIDISRNKESYRMYEVFGTFNVCVYQNSEHYVRLDELFKNKDYIGVRNFCETMVLQHVSPAVIKQCINDAFDKGKEQGIFETQQSIRAALGV
jgi:hypothetical protein